MDTITSEKILTMAFGPIQLQRSQTVPFSYYGKIDGYGDGKLTGVLIASAEGDFIDFVCNQGLERIVAAVNDGRLGEALVVHATIAADNTIRAVGIKDARELLNQIRQQNPRTKSTSRGQIWILSPAFFGLNACDAPF